MSETPPEVKAAWYFAAHFPRPVTYDAALAKLNAEYIHSPVLAEEAAKKATPSYAEAMRKVYARRGELIRRALDYAKKNEAELRAKCDAALAQRQSVSAALGQSIVAPFTPPQGSLF